MVLVFVLSLHWESSVRLKTEGRSEVSCCIKSSEGRKERRKWNMISCGERLRADRSNWHQYRHSLVALLFTFSTDAKESCLHWPKCPFIDRPKIDIFTRGRRQFSFLWMSCNFYTSYSVFILLLLRLLHHYSFYYFFFKTFIWVTLTTRTPLLFHALSCLPIFPILSIVLI